MDLFDIAAKISLDSKEFEAGMEKADSQGSTFATKLKSGLGTAVKVGGAAIAAIGVGTVALGKKFVSSAQETATYGDEIDKMSQKLGLSREAYQEWDYVLGQSGADIASMSTGLKTLTNKLDDAKNGGEDAQKMFEMLGLSLEDLQSMTREDIFSAVITGFQGMEDSTERAALANDLFGKSGQELTPLFNTTIEETNNLKQAAHDLGFIMSDEAVGAAADFKDSLDTLQRTLGGLKNNLMSQFLPSITKVTDGLTKIFGGQEGGVAEISEGVTEIINTLSEKVPEFLDIGFQIIESIGMAITENLPSLIERGSDLILNGILPGIIDNLPQIVETAFTVLAQFVSAIGQALPTLIPAAVSMVIQIVESLLDNIDLLIDAAIQLIIGLATGLIEAIPILLEKAPEIIVKLVQAIIRNAPKLLQAAVTLISTIGQGIANAWEIVKGWGKDVISKISEGISSLWADVVSWGSDIINNIAEGLTNGISSITDIGKNIISGIWEGISGAAGWLTGLLNGINGLFGIASPSKVFRDQIGKWLPLGLEEGFEDEMPKVENDLQNSLDEMAGKLDASISYSNGKNISNRMYEYDLQPERPIYLVLDSGELVGKIVQKMDVALGNENTMKLRFGGATV